MTIDKYLLFTCIIVPITIWFLFELLIIKYKEVYKTENLYFTQIVLTKKLRKKIIT
jgi:hypothetical protein